MLLLPPAQSTWQPAVPRLRLLTSYLQVCCLLQIVPVLNNSTCLHTCVIRWPTRTTMRLADIYSALFRVYKIGGVGVAGPLSWPSPIHLRWQSAQLSRPTTGPGAGLSTLAAPPSLPFTPSMVARCQRRQTTHSSFLVTATVLMQRWLLLLRVLLHAEAFRTKLAASCTCFSFI